MRMRKLSTVIGVIFTVISATGMRGLAEDEVIYGCYKKRNGELRVVSSPDQCRPSEMPIYWNQIGLQGPRGPQGDQGPPGLDGLPGENCLKLYDSTGEELGVLTGPFTLGDMRKVSIFLRSLGKLMELELSPYERRLVPPGKIGRFRYTQTGCRGTPYSECPDLWRYYYVHAFKYPGDDIYHWYVWGYPNWEPVLFKSWRNWDGDCVDEDVQENECYQEAQKVTLPFVWEDVTPPYVIE